MQVECWNTKSVIFSLCPICTKYYKNSSCSVTFSYVCAFWCGIANIPSTLTTVVFWQHQTIPDIYVSVAYVITNCACFIILAESV